MSTAGSTEAGFEPDGWHVSYRNAADLDSVTDDSIEIAGSRNERARTERERSTNDQ